MLVLTRTQSESIVIDEKIEVTVLDVRGGKVRLGIVAPRSIPVHRKEIQLLIDKAKEERKSNGIKLDMSSSTH